MNKKRLLILTITLLLCYVQTSFSQPIKLSKLLKKTEESLKNINTLVYKISRTDKNFSSNDTVKGTAVGILYISHKDKMGAYHILSMKPSNARRRLYRKYDGHYTASLNYHTDSLNVNKKIRIEDVKKNDYSSITGSFIQHYFLKDYLNKRNIFSQYRSILAKFQLKDITIEESIYLNTPVYILTVYGKDNLRSNRINNMIEKHYIRKSDFLPIVQSFYGEFEGMKQTEFTEIEYLEINPDISIDKFKIDPSINEVNPRIYFEEFQKYNL